MNRGEIKAKVDALLRRVGPGDLMGPLDWDLLWEIGENLRDVEEPGAVEVTEELVALARGTRTGKQEFVITRGNGKGVHRFKVIVARDR